MRRSRSSRPRVSVTARGAASSGWTWSGGRITTRYLPQNLPRLERRLAAMAHRVLLRRRQLRARHPQPRYDEDRVVAEAVLPTRRMADAPPEHAVHRPHAAVRRRDGDDAAEARRPPILRHPPHLVEDDLHAVLVAERGV